LAYLEALCFLLILSFLGFSYLTILSVRLAFLFPPNKTLTMQSTFLYYYIYFFKLLKFLYVKIISSVIAQPLAHVILQDTQAIFIYIQKIDKSREMKKDEKRESQAIIS